MGLRQYGFLIGISLVSWGLPAHAMLTLESIEQITKVILIRNGFNEANQKQFQTLVDEYKNDDIFYPLVIEDSKNPKGLANLIAEAGSVKGGLDAIKGKPASSFEKYLREQIYQQIEKDADTVPAQDLVAYLDFLATTNVTSLNTQWDQLFNSPSSAGASRNRDGALAKKVGERARNEFKLHPEAFGAFTNEELIRHGMWIETTVRGMNVQTRLNYLLDQLARRPEHRSFNELFLDDLREDINLGNIDSLIVVFDRFPIGFQSKDALKRLPVLLSYLRRVYQEMSPDKKLLFAKAAPLGKPSHDLLAYLDFSGHWVAEEARLSGWAMRYAQALGIDTENLINAAIADPLFEDILKYLPIKTLFPEFIKKPYEEEKFLRDLIHVDIPEVGININIYARRVGLRDWLIAKFAELPGVPVTAIRQLFVEQDFAYSSLGTLLETHPEYEGAKKMVFENHLVFEELKRYWLRRSNDPLCGKLSTPSWGGPIPFNNN